LKRIEGRSQPAKSLKRTDVKERMTEVKVQKKKSKDNKRNKEKKENI
jgi:hypothetical protein